MPGRLPNILPWEFTDLWQNPEYRDLKLQLLKRNFDARVLAMAPAALRKQ